MALSQAAVVAKIRDLIDEVTGLERVYAASETDGNAIPPAFNELPCAVVFPGPTQGYILSSGEHRHTYEVRVQLLEAGADLGGRAYTVLPLVDAIIEKFVGNVIMGGLANPILFKRDSGLVGLEWGAVTYTGYEITLEVSELASATPAAGT